MSPESDLSSVRVSGGVSARFGTHGGTTVVQTLGQRGGYRLVLPYRDAPGSRHAEAVQINTGGGVAGGDRVSARVEVVEGADVVFSSQGAERIYRSSGQAARLDVEMRISGSSRLDWLPQQTILYAGARLERRIAVEMGPESRLLMAEILTFGRAASAEIRCDVAVNDQWRVRRGGRLVFAEAFRLSGDMADMMDRSAIGGGARCAATLLYVAGDGPDRLEELRSAVEECGCEVAASAWNGLLGARVLAREPGSAIAAVSAMARCLARRDMPRVWSI